jgi:hypothetical protein
MDGFRPMAQVQQGTRDVANEADGLGIGSARLLKLSTAAGPVYVCPSGWQRTRLLWTFRHFRLLCPQVLSRGERRLVERLCRTAVVTPTERVIGSTVFGVVENLPSMVSHSSAPARKAVDSRTGDLATSLTIPERLYLERFRPGYIPVDRGSPSTNSDLPSGRGTARGGATRRREWMSVSLLSAICVAAILVRAFGISPIVVTTYSKVSQTLSAAPARIANVMRPPSLGALASPRLQSSLSQAATPFLGRPATKQSIVPLTAELPSSVGDSSAPARRDAPYLKPNRLAAAAATADPGTSALLQISELPQAGLTYPVVAHPNLTGKVNLKALIGVDGAVKQVTVLSGNRTLADAAQGAVRSWHYVPYKVQGHVVEAETDIIINFAGQEAVSITFADGARTRVADNKVFR